MKSGYSPGFASKLNLRRLTPDPIEDLTPIQSKRSYEIMQIINEKPQIDDVIEAHIRANGHEIKQRNRYNDAFEIHSCFRKFETANFETQNPEVKYLIPFNTSTLYGNSYKVVETGPNYPQNAEDNFSNLKPEFIETGLQIVTNWTAESSYCPLVREDWN